MPPVRLSGSGRDTRDRGVRAGLVPDRSQTADQVGRRRHVAPPIRPPGRATCPRPWLPSRCRSQARSASPRSLATPTVLAPSSAGRSPAPSPRRASVRPSPPSFCPPRRLVRLGCRRPLCGPGAGAARWLLSLTRLVARRAARGGGAALGADEPSTVWRARVRLSRRWRPSGDTLGHDAARTKLTRAATAKGRRRGGGRRGRDHAANQTGGEAARRGNGPTTDEGRRARRRPSGRRRTAGQRRVGDQHGTAARPESDGGWAAGQAGAGRQRKRGGLTNATADRRAAAGSQTTRLAADQWRAPRWRGPAEQPAGEGE